MEFRNVLMLLAYLDEDLSSDEFVTIGSFGPFQEITVECGEADYLVRKTSRIQDNDAEVLLRVEKDEFMNILLKSKQKEFVMLVSGVLSCGTIGPTGYVIVSSKVHDPGFLLRASSIEFIPTQQS